MNDLVDLVERNEDWLVERILFYAKQQGYTKYTSTLLEAWRLSICGLSASLVEGAKHFGDIPELAPDDDYARDPVTSFGVVEARRHRQRGVSLPMFLGLMKYYRQSYIDLVKTKVPDEGRAHRCQLFLERCFDRIEIAFCHEWAGTEGQERLAELQVSARCLANEKNAYVTLFESLSDPVVMLNEANRVAYLNLAAARLVDPDVAPGADYYHPQRGGASVPDGHLRIIGKTREPFVGRRLVEMLPWLAGCIPGALSPPGDGSGGSISEVRARIQGEERCFELRRSCMLDVSQKYAGTILSLRDITDRRRAEQERRQTEAKLQHAQKLESLGVLAGGIAHDFNNLLTGILGNSSLALAELPSNSRLRSGLEQIERSALRAAELTNQMLAYSGRGSFVVGPIHLSDLIRDTAELLASSISKTAVLQFQLGPDVPPIVGDAAQIRQVIMNLIINASEAIGADGGMITVTTGVIEADKDCLSRAATGQDLPEGDHVFLRVSDSGCGMDAETKSRIFDPFFTTKFTGRGLGLAATLGIVRGHRAAITVDSESGKGTTFTLLFPIMDEARAAEAATDTPNEDEDVIEGTVLVVDDEEVVRDIAAKVLDRAGFGVLTACDGQDAVRAFRRHADEILAVLLDRSMPGMDAKDVFAEIRRIRSDVRIVLTSGYSEEEAIEEFDRRSLAGFVQKPFEPGKLIKQFHALAREWSCACGGR
ncbi:MAG: response regulator [Phycisphaerae bacterium]|nr:response regulator [Phycisphaerae bacterium]